MMGLCSATEIPLLFLPFFIFGKSDKKKKEKENRKKKRTCILENTENLSRVFGAKEVVQKNGSSQKFGVLATGSSGTIHIYHTWICMSCLSGSLE